MAMCNVLKRSSYIIPAPTWFSPPAGSIDSMNGRDEECDK